MKKLIAVLLIMTPTAAMAMGGMHGARGGGNCGYLAAVLYALLAALGYGVMQHAYKETINHVKKTGQVVGMVLVVIGLTGFLCGTTNHILKSMKSCSGKCAMEMMGSDKAGYPDCPMMRMGYGPMKTEKGK